MGDQGSEGLLSPWLRERRFQAAAPFLKGKVLDFGCGSGALAAWVDADRYVGMEVDAASLRAARSRFSNHRFLSELPQKTERFDTIVSLAVIEHVSAPAEFLSTLAAYLEETTEARLVITTPHPSVQWVHELGAAVGLFSRHASEEHESLLDRTSLEITGSRAGLNLVSYSRFLFGANQVAVYAKGSL